MLLESHVPKENEEESDQQVMTPEQALLARLWIEALQLNAQTELGLDDDMRIIGATSLHVYALVSALHRAGYHNVEPLDVYRCPTIRLLSKFLSQVALQATPSGVIAVGIGGVSVAHRWARPADARKYCLEIALSRSLATLLKAEAVALDDDCVEILTRRFHPLSQLGFMDRYFQEAYKLHGVAGALLSKRLVYSHRSPHAIASACSYSPDAPTPNIHELPTSQLEEFVVKAVKEVTQREDITHHTDLLDIGWTNVREEQLHKVLHNSHPELPYPLPSFSPATTPYQIALSIRATTSDAVLSKPPTSFLLPLFTPSTVTESTPWLIFAHPAIRTSLSYKALSFMFNNKFVIYGIEECGSFQYYDTIQDMARVYL